MSGNGGIGEELAVEAIDPDELSPKAALETLYRLRKLLSSEGA